MNQRQELVAHLLQHGRDMSWHELALKFNMRDGEEARIVWRAYRKTIPDSDSIEIPESIVQMPPRRTFEPTKRLEKEKYIIGIEDKITKFEEDMEKGTAQVEALVGQEIKTLDELVEKCKIDLTKWDIAKWVQNFWNNKYQVKAFLVPKKVAMVDGFMEFLKTFEGVPHVPLDTNEDCAKEIGPCTWENNPGNVKPIDPNEKENLLILSLADFHLDKQDYLNPKQVSSHVANYRQALDNITRRAIGSHNITDILFVIGNDFFHTDNIQDSTTAGTPQDVSTSWHDAYARGFELMVESITQLARIPRDKTLHTDPMSAGLVVPYNYIRLHVVLVQGNHPATKEFYMAHGLAAYFKNVPNVSFDIRPVERKVYSFGQNFFGLTHGDCKTDKLPLTFATEFGQEWGNSRFKEILIGHRHIDKNVSFISKNEFNGVGVRTMPSLSGTDKWHYVNQYTENVQRGIGIVYHKDKGKVCELYHNII